uniref:Uncharacterized protein n=1 Tax=Arundo donax TaxID=35708 RepID=A0A0A9E047_ARUDO
MHLHRSELGCKSKIQKNECHTRGGEDETRRKKSGNGEHA